MRSARNRERSSERKRLAERNRAQRGRPLKPCAWHRPAFSNDYLGWHDNAERRHARGEQQILCGDCNLYFWPHEFGEKLL